MRPERSREKDTRARETTPKNMNEWSDWVRITPFGRSGQVSVMKTRLKTPLLPGNFRWKTAQVGRALGFGFGFRVSGFGFRVSGFGLRVSGFGFQVSGFEFRASSFGFRASGFRLRVSGFGFRVSGFGFRVSGSGFRVSDFVLRVSGFGFRVPGAGFREPDGMRRQQIVGGLRTAPAPKRYVSTHRLWFHTGYFSHR